MKSKIHNIGWIIFLLFGLLQISTSLQSLCILCFEPGHWDWLTIDPEIIDYIKFYFRIYGIRVFGFAVMTLLATFYGLREGYRSAWRVLWLVPLLVLIHIFLWPWLALILIGVALLAGVGLGLTYPKAITAKNEG